MNQAHISEFVIASMKAETFGTWLIEGFNTRTVKLLDCYFNFESASGRESLVETARKILDDNELETLQRAWSQVFCIGPGCVPPEESVVKTGLSMQEPRDMALDWYYRFKIKPAAGLPADNLGVELLFLGRILSSIPEDNGKNERPQRDRNFCSRKTCLDKGFLCLARKQEGQPRLFSDSSFCKLNPRVH